MSFRLTPEAVDDVINVYTQGVMMFGHAQADKYHAKLESLFILLGDAPRLARERTEIDPPVRVHPFGSHVVVYRMDGEDIIIVAVRHARENWLEDL